MSGENGTERGQGFVGEEKKWWDDWVEQLINLLKLRSLESVVEKIDADDGVKQDLFRRLQRQEKEEDGVLVDLRGALREGNKPKIEGLVKKLLGVDEDRDIPKPDQEESGISFWWSNMGQELKEDDHNGGDRLKKIKEEVEKRGEEVDQKIGVKGGSVGDKEKQALGKLREEVAELVEEEVSFSEVENDKLKDKSGRVFEKIEDELKVEKDRLSRREKRRRKREFISREFKLQKARELVDDFLSDKLEKDDDDRLVLDKVQLESANYLFELSIEVEGDDGELLSEVLSEVRNRLMMEMKAEDIVSFIGRNVGDGGESEDGLLGINAREIPDEYRQNISYLQKIYNEMSRSVGLDGFESEIARTMGVSIDEKILKELNPLIKGRFGIEDALVFDEEYKLYRLNTALTEEEKEKINRYFQQELFEQVRFMIDESVSLQQTQFEPRAKRYVTLMSIIGLDTAMKVRVMDRYQMQYLGFMAANGFINEDVTQKINEYFAKLGAEGNILKGMKEMELFKVINHEGKEIEIGLFNLFNFDKTYLGKVVDPEDRKYFGIEDGQERNYATMVFRSNNAEVKSKDRARAVRQLLKQNLNVDEYEALRDKFKKDRMSDLEAELALAKAVGDRYWDYTNSLLVYWQGTGKFSELIIGDASGKAGVNDLPRGLPEYYVKTSPGLFFLFANTYNTAKVLEVLEPFSRVLPSLTVKEAKEMFPHLLNIDVGTNQAPDIIEALLGGIEGLSSQEMDKKKVFAKKIQQTMIKALYISDVYHLDSETERVVERTPLYKNLPILRDGKGDLQVDTFAVRRDMTSTVELMKNGLSSWTDEELKMWDWEWIKKHSQYDERLLKMIDGDNLSQREKIERWIDNFSDAYATPENLSAKRGDNPMKYAGSSYWGEIFKGLNSLVMTPDWATFLDVLQKATAIAGIGKGDRQVLRAIELFRWLREERGIGERVVFYKKGEDGRLKFDLKSYKGSLAGQIPLPSLREKRVLPADVRENGKNGKVSVASMQGAPPGMAIDEEGDYRNQVVPLLKQRHLLSDGTYKKLKKKLRFERWWNGENEWWLELWRLVNGKKLLNYVAVDLLKMSPEMFMELIMEEGGKLFKLLGGYFNS